MEKELSDLQNWLFNFGLNLNQVNKIMRRILDTHNLIY